jgi:hypothetical protein
VGRGLGRVQVAILDHLRARRGDTCIGGSGAPLFILGPGIHDMRLVAAEMTRQRASSAPRLQVAFSRAVRGLVKRGYLEPLPIVPISFAKPNRRYSRFVYELTDGAYFLPPSGKKWSRRFLRLVGFAPFTNGVDREEFAALNRPSAAVRSLGPERCRRA